MEIFVCIFFKTPLNKLNFLNKIIPTIFKLYWYQETHLLLLLIMMLYVIVLYMKIMLLSFNG